MHAHNLALTVFNTFNILFTFETVNIKDKILRYLKITQILFTMIVKKGKYGQEAERIFV